MSGKKMKQARSAQKTNSNSIRPILRIDVPYPVEDQLKEIAQNISLRAGLPIQMPPALLVQIAVEEWLVWIKKDGNIDELVQTMAAERKERGHVPQPTKPYTATGNQRLPANEIPLPGEVGLLPIPHELAVRLQTLSNRFDKITGRTGDSVSGLALALLEQTVAAYEQPGVAEAYGASMKEILDDQN